MTSYNVDFASSFSNLIDANGWFRRLLMAGHLLHFDGTVGYTGRPKTNQNQHNDDRKLKNMREECFAVFTHQKTRMLSMGVQINYTENSSLQTAC